MRTWIKYALLGLLAFLVIAQLFRPDRSVPETPPEQDFLAITQPPVPIMEIIQTVCYDCHGHTTVYPWYAEIAPVSWWLQDHINEGRSHLNFSIWGSYSPKKAAHKLEECFEEVASGEMPLNSYTWMHANARLTEEQRSALVGWFKQEYAKVEQ